MTDTAVALRDPKAALAAGGNVAAIIPQNIEQAFRLAGAIHASGLAPQTLKGPEQIMVAIMAGAELGLAPFQSLQSFAVINGRPAIWGDGLMAVVRSQGFKVREWIDGEGEAMVARCEVTRPDNGEVTPGEFSIGDAKKAGLWGKTGPWQTYPRRMLKMRARAFALRDGAADVLRGFQIREEVEDYTHVRDITPKAAGVMARLEAHGAPGAGGFAEGAVEAGINRPLTPAAIEEIIEEAVVETAAELRSDFPGDRPLNETADQSPAEEGGYGEPGADTEEADPQMWCRDQMRHIEDAQTMTDLDGLRDAPDAPALFAALEAHSPSDAKALNAAMTGKRKALTSMARAS